ncbi:VOC family protein [Streptomyces sp. NPDC091273]|uniref:VOC family protein n=1 Tax=Streptomyces sp. NPDC091273 TaxID=3365982 RepID=UPI00381B4E58
MAPSHDREPPFTALGRTVVLVADAEAALAFYRDVLGFAVLHDRTADGYRYLHIGLPGPTGQPAVGLWLMPAATARERDLIGRQCGGQPMLVLYTDDVRRTGTRLRARGVRVWNERVGDAGRSLHFADLYGNVIVAAQLTGS